MNQLVFVFEFKIRGICVSPAPHSKIEYVGQPKRNKYLQKRITNKSAGLSFENPNGAGDIYQISSI